MKKVFGILLLFLLPTMIFSEVVFMPRVGFDIHKGIKNQMLDNLLKKVVNAAVNSGKKAGDNPKQISDKDIPHSSPLVSMFTVGLDMHFIAHRSGFTFFWNNEFSYANNFKAYEKFNFLREPMSVDENILSKEYGSFDSNQKFRLISTELLLGATFRREQAFNIHFGLGLKLGISPSVGVIMAAFSGDPTKIPDSMTVMVLPAFGGTFGFTYYFSKVVGISASVNEFVGFGAFVSTKILERDDANNPKKAVGYASMGFNNNFAMKIGLNLRVNGVRDKGF